MSACEVGLNTSDCEHPPGVRSGRGFGSLGGLPPVRTTCGPCGKVACKACSAKVGRMRRCNDCAGEYQ